MLVHSCFIGREKPANINRASREANELLSGLSAHKIEAAKGRIGLGQGTGAGTAPAVRGSAHQGYRAELVRCQTPRTEHFYT